MNTIRFLLTPILAVALLLVTTLGHSAEVHADVFDLRARWAAINYDLEGKRQLEAFEVLRSDAERYTEKHPHDANGWIWSGIIKSTYAGTKGGLGALSLAKAARKDLEIGLGIDDRAMDGSAYTTLGTLYYNVPGWPLGFGSDKKAEQMLRKGLGINPDGIDSNYFLAEFLRDQGNANEARVYYVKAQAAVPRPERPAADRGRRQDIDAALNALGAE